LISLELAKSSPNNSSKLQRKETLFMKKTLLALFTAALLPTLAHATVASSPMRLVEVADGQRHWMTESDIAGLATESHAAGRCGGYMDITDFPDLPVLHLAPIEGLELLSIREEPAVQAALSVLDSSRMRADVEKLSSFHNRYYQSQTGEQAALWIKEQFDVAGLRRSDLKIELFRHANFRQPSVIATLQGSGPDAAEHIILGAHLDSIQAQFGFPSAGARAPGADDDASGVATLLETFRSVIETGFRPNRTLVFMAYAGEERGLLGSQEISRAWRNQSKVVRGVLQLDMTMYPGTERAITFVTDHVSADLTRFSIQLVEHYVKAPWRETQCGYACSDHASWSKLGYPAAFPFEASFNGSNQAIHTERDLIGLLDMEHGLHFAKLGAAFAIEMAGSVN
jgi:leucyl aminopeptidase